MTSTSSPATGTATACYVYGIVLERTAAEAHPDRLHGVADTGGQVTSVRHRGIAAVVSDIPTDRPLGRPDDLRAHARVLDTLAAGFDPVLPFRFGAVLRDSQAVVDELLEPYHDDFLGALESLADRAQYSLRARYELDTVLPEVLEEVPEARRLREEVQGLSEEAGYDRRIRLGEIVSEAVARKRELDAREIERVLAPLATAAAFTETTTAEGLADAAFLVERRRSEAFEAAAEELAGRWYGRVRLRLLGPLAAYDFAPELMGGSDGPDVAGGPEGEG
ncbi:GvpL/GvpF family gas vesicle protein [Peterkaempfera bronchialis]|uniref:GvpL/GvpF family gas vesicle protein n=1 Tax=Peterkaempfera bronchialis TaxID=2126346 RepID=UPI003C2D89D2